MNYQGTKIAEPPTLSGIGGKAWRVRMPPVGQRIRPDHDGTVSVWVVNAPGAHPFWSYWVLSVIHLRQIEGTRPPHKSFPDATHELMIFALDPEKPLPPLDVPRDSEWPLYFLEPLDVVQQFEAATDEIADEIGELAVRSIVAGRASPDQDYRSWWRDSIQATANHYRSGKHEAMK